MRLYTSVGAGIARSECGTATGGCRYGYGRILIRNPGWMRSGGDRMIGSADSPLSLAERTGLSLAFGRETPSERKGLLWPRALCPDAVAGCRLPL